MSKKSRRNRFKQPPPWLSEKLIRKHTFLNRPGKGENAFEKGIAALGLSYERQAIIGPFYADFLIKRWKVVVEVDGVGHSTDAEVAKDKSRTRYLRKHGYRVARVSAKRAEENPLGSAFLAIRDVLSAEEFDTLIRNREADLRLLSSYKKPAPAPTPRPSPVTEVIESPVTLVTEPTASVVSGHVYRSFLPVVRPKAPVARRLITLGREPVGVIVRKKSR